MEDIGIEVHQAQDSAVSLLEDSGCLYISASSLDEVVHRL